MQKLGKKYIYPMNGRYETKIICSKTVLITPFKVAEIRLFLLILHFSECAITKQIWEFTGSPGKSFVAAGLKPRASWSRANSADHWTTTTLENKKVEWFAKRSWLRCLDNSEKPPFEIALVWNSSYFVYCCSNGIRTGESKIIGHQDNRRVRWQPLLT